MTELHGVALADCERDVRDWMNGTSVDHRGRGFAYCLGRLLAEYDRRGAELERQRARVAELDAAEERTEWSVRAPHGAVWQLSPHTERHAWSMQASEGEGVLVAREARTIHSPWREVSS